MALKHNAVLTAGLSWHLVAVSWNRKMWFEYFVIRFDLIILV